MFNIEKPDVTGSTATGETKLPNSLDKLSESQKLATEKKGMQSKIPSVSYSLDLSARDTRDENSHY
jgi:hypothetical protein